MSRATFGSLFEGQGHSMTFQHNCVRPITFWLKVDSYNYSQEWSPYWDSVSRATFGFESQGHSMTLQQNRVWPKTLFEIGFYNYFWQTTSLCPIPIRGALPGSDRLLFKPFIRVVTVHVIFHAQQFIKQSESTYWHLIMIGIRINHTFVLTSITELSACKLKQQPSIQLDKQDIDDMVLVSTNKLLLSIKKVVLVNRASHRVLSKIVLQDKLQFICMTSAHLAAITWANNQIQFIKVNGFTLKAEITVNEDVIVMGIAA